MEPVRISISQRLHRNRRMVVIASVVVTIVTVSVFLGLSLNTIGTVNVMGVEVQIHYLGLGQEYFGNSVQNFTWNFKTLYTGESFHFSFKITNFANSTHTVDSITLGTSGFSLVSTGEPAPTVIMAHSSQTFDITIESPDYGYVGGITINILAS